MQTLLIRFIFLASLFNVSHAFALALSPEMPEQDPTPEVQYLEDKTGQLAFEDMTKLAVSQQFKPVKASNKIINLGNSTSTFWLKFPLKNVGDPHVNWVLDVQSSRLGEITFYGFNAAPIKTGAQLPFNTRPYAYQAFAFPLDLQSQAHDYYLKVKSDYLITLPIQIRTVSNFYQHNQKVLLIQATYFSAIVIISFFSFFLFLRIKEKMFLYYTLFIFCFGLAMFAKQGFGRVYFWPDSSHFDFISQGFFTNIACLFANFFSREFIHTKQFSIKIDNALKWLGFIFIVMAILLLLTIYLPIPSQPIFAVFPIFTLLSTLIIVYAIWRTYVLGAKTPKLFTAAWLMLLMGATLSNLRAFGVIPANDLTVHAVQIFSAIEILLWSIALINTFFEERKLKNEAVHEALSTHELLIENQKNTQDNLEREVAKRTHELNEAIAKEKAIRVKHMRFGAMISHEFRNPLAIIDSHATLILKEQSPASEALVKRIKTITTASNRLHTLFDKWIKNDHISMLHEHIHLANLNIYDLVEALFNKCKDMYPEHEFILQTDKKKKLMIEANQDWIEMAILNLVDNACKYSKPHTQITIQCLQENGQTCVAIIDNGIGIKPEFHDKIFTEYYRVNATGATSGIGLGLALVKKIVELHHATIDFVSIPKKGSTFRISFNNPSTTAIT